MAGMTRNSSASTLAGFSVFQTALGASLQFLPALGTPELDTLVDAFLPGPASLKDKRATICMDFCEYARQTGETMKFYPVYTAPATSTTDSPASSMYDSGYSSNYNASPVVSDMSLWTQPTSFSAPSPLSQSRTKSRKSSASSSKALAGDFSHLPGMKIMTKEGLDVTNSASRGCKSKEQRDHAHLMRIIKACDACKKKKIRCDPSHKKRSASQAQSSSPEPKPSKKVKKERTSSERQSDPPAMANAGLAVASASFDFETADQPESQYYYNTNTYEDSWEQYVKYDDEPAAVIPPDYDFFLDPRGYFSSPSSGSSISPSQPFTPAADASCYSDVYSGSLFPEPDDVEATTLPYLNPGGLQGTNYIDFNLYSPSPSLLDEELQQHVQTTKAGLTDRSSRSSRERSPVLRETLQDQASASATANGLQQQAATNQEAESYFCGCSDESSQQSQSLGVSSPPWSVPGDPRPSSSPRAASQQSVSEARVSTASVPWFSLSQSSAPLNAPSQTGLPAGYLQDEMSLRRLSTRRRTATMTTATSSATLAQSTVNASACASGKPMGAVFDPSLGQAPLMPHGKDGVASLSSLRVSSAVLQVSSSAMSSMSSGLSSSIAGPQLRLEGLRARIDSYDQASQTSYSAMSGNSALSPTSILLTATLLLTIPIRQLVDGSLRQWSLGSLVVGLGLVSLFSMYLLQSLSAGDSADGKLPAIALSVAAPMAVRQYTTAAPSPPSGLTWVESGFVNVKSKIQGVAREFTNLRCLVSRRLTSRRLPRTLNR